MLKHSLISASSWCELRDVDILAIRKIIGWESTPFFPKRGRTAWLELKQPFLVTFGNRSIPIKAVKIKGVGLRNHLQEVVPPSSQMYFRTITHLGITDNADFIELSGEPSPMGGIGLDRAFVEFQVPSALLINGCYCQIPLLLFLYQEPDLTCQVGNLTSMPLAVVVSGLVNQHYFRSDIIASYPFETKEKRIVADEWMNKLTVDESQNPWLSSMSQIWYLYSQNLRKFHEAGFYRNNASPTNYGYSPEMKNIYFTDMDSARPLVECSTLAKPLQLMRDVSSPLFQAMYLLLRRKIINCYELDEIFKYRIFRKILEGYFYDVEDHELESTLLTIQNIFRVVYAAVRKKYQDDVFQENPLTLNYQAYMRASDIERRNLIDRPAIFVQCIVSMSDIYSKCKLHEKYPLQIDKKTLKTRAIKFVKNRNTV